MCPTVNLGMQQIETQNYKYVWFTVAIILFGVNSNK
jgi:hypothetical protein